MDGLITTPQLEYLTSIQGYLTRKDKLRPLAISAKFYDRTDSCLISLNVLMRDKDVQGFAESLQHIDEVTSKYGSQCSKGLPINVYPSTALHRQGCIQSVFSNIYMYQVCCKDSAKPCTGKSLQIMAFSIIDRHTHGFCQNTFGLSMYIPSSHACRQCRISESNRHYYFCAVPDRNQIQTNLMCQVALYPVLPALSHKFHIQFTAGIHRLIIVPAL